MPERFGFVWRFSLTASSCLRIHRPLTIGHYSAATRHYLPALRRNQRAQIMAQTLPRGYCLSPTAQLPKFERALSRRGGGCLF